MEQKVTSVIFYLPNGSTLMYEVGEEAEFGKVERFMVSSNPLVVRVYQENKEELYAGIPFIAQYENIPNE